jgi:glutamate decarboxylase
VKALVVPFIRAADEAAPLKAFVQGAPEKANGAHRNVLVTSRRPEELVKQLTFSLPEGEGRGEDGLLETIQSVLAYSVNTWDQGFMDKLYASTNAVGTLVM